LFFEGVRLVRELQPRAVVLENVAALLTRGLDRVLGTLAEIGYDAQWHCIPAAAVGAPHIRDMVFVVAYSVRDSYGINDRAKQARHPKDTNAGGVSRGSDEGESPDVANARRKLRQSRAVSESSCEASPHGDAEAKDDQRRGEDVADANGWRFEECKERNGEPSTWKQAQQRDNSLRRDLRGWWATEPDVGRVANGIPKRVDRLRCLGNAIVPQVAEVVARMTKQQLDW